MSHPGAGEANRPDAAVDSDELCTLALSPARLGARTATDAQAEIRRQGGARTTKSSETDLVTEADRATERVIRDALLDARPGDGFLGEESVSEWTDDPRGDADDRVVWVVDPIDGTTNYVYGQPDWGISVAATRGGRSLVGVVIAARLDLEYAAPPGGGATRNGERPVVAESPPLSQALVATGFGYDPGRRGRQGAVATALLPQVRDLRRRGAAALDFCYVADGSVDAYYETGPHWWDFAAGSLVATEAGARVTAQPLVAGPTGGPVATTAEPTSGWFLLAAAPPLFGSLSDVLTRLGAAGG